MINNKSTCESPSPELPIITSRHVEQRCGDRRRKQRLWAMLGNGRRQTQRRYNDKLTAYVDRYPASLRVLCLGLIALSCSDAFLTLALLAKGAIEVNPLMRALLEQGNFIFFYTKLLLTTFGVALLLIRFRFRWLRLVPLFYILYIFLFGYLTLIVYESYLLMQA